MPGKLSSKIQQQIEIGVSILREGGLVAYPTDTIYGLGACINIPEAVERVYQVKGRPRNIPLPVLLSDVSQIAEVAETVPPLAWRLIGCFLPGALTIVLRRSSSVPAYVSAGGTTIAIRIPAHPVPLALIRGLGAPIVGTSANRSGRNNPLTATEVYNQLGDKIDLIIDGGRCPGGKESTIVNATGESPLILRVGAISRDAIEKVCGKVLVEKGGI